jgi:hypothetical protein
MGRVKVPLLHNLRRYHRTRSPVPGSCRVEAFQLCTTALERWLDKADTNPDLTDSNVEYAWRQGTIKMEEAIRDAPLRFRGMVVSQDTIGWRRFLEGMIWMEITDIHQQYIAVNGSRMSLDK